VYREAQKTARRRFLNTAFVGACGLAIGERRAVPLLKTVKKSSILWIMSDERSACFQLLRQSRGSNTSVEALAESSIAFDDHYCNLPQLRAFAESRLPAPCSREKAELMA
jgi:hypothetical protein